MPIRPGHGRSTRAHVPDFGEGVTGGTGGTVSDGGQRGRLTFTMPSSGHTDPADGCFIAWPARDSDGRLLPACPDSLVSASDVRAGTPHGEAQVTVVTSPTADAGVRVGIAVVAAPTAAEAVSVAAQGHGAELDFTSTPGVRASLIRAAGWVVTTAETHASIGRARVAGDLLRHAVATGLSAGADVARGGRYVGAETILGSGNQGDSIWLVAYAYRTGATSGAEAVTIDIEARLQSSGVSG